jgi:hypothetical protein
MSHRVEFTIPFSEVRGFAQSWANEKGIQLPDGGQFDFRIERDNTVGFAHSPKPDALGVKVEKS